MMLGALFAHCVCMYIYIYTYVCTYACIHVYIYIYIYTYDIHLLCTLVHVHNYSISSPPARVTSKNDRSSALGYPAAAFSVSCRSCALALA